MERRRFLGLVTAACGSSVVGCSDGPKAASGPIAAGSVKTTPIGHLAFLTGQPVVLGRDDRGLYAMTAICTHDDCDLSKSGGVDSSGLHCDCHGSRFDKNGKVSRGPASSALEHYRVDLAGDGAITVQAGTIVGADARTPVA